MRKSAQDASSPHRRVLLNGVLEGALEVTPDNLHGTVEREPGFRGVCEGEEVVAFGVEHACTGSK